LGVCEPQREKSVDAKTFPGISHQSVTAQIKKRDRYLEVIRQRVTDGTYQLTARPRQVARAAVCEATDGD